MPNEFSHFDAEGASRMIDVGEKPVTERMAKASAVVRMSAATLRLVRDRSISKKGDVLEVARLAGIMAAKKTAELIPLCHTLPLDGVTVDFELIENAIAVNEENAAPSLCPLPEGEGSEIRIDATARCTGKTGVEMEALTAASVAALTIYDMCKSAERGIVIERVQLESKSGGRSGEWRRKD
jgi:cyclic pyranopterin monophosphate synthase